eukprot:15651-Heterococcus_DN1.PRE.2
MMHCYSTLQQLFCCKPSEEKSAAAAYIDFVDYVLFHVAYEVIALQSLMFERICLELELVQVAHRVHYTSHLLHAPV